MELSIAEILDGLKTKNVEIGAVLGNRFVMEIQKSNGRKRPGFIKIAIPDEMANRLLRGICEPIVIPLLLLLPARETKELVGGDAT